MLIMDFPKKICKTNYPLTIAITRFSWFLLSDNYLILGFKGSTSSEEMLDFLSTKSTEDIIDKLGEGFNPVMDGYFLPEFPKQLYAKGLVHPVDLLVGFNSHEGANFIFDLAKTKSVTTLDKAQELVDFVIKNIFFRGNSRADDVCRAIWQEYFKGGTLETEDDITLALVDMYGDLLFISPTIEIINLHKG